MTVAAAIFPSREELLASVKRILSTYAGTAVTVRQLYYRLVAAGAIPNTLRSYKNVVAALGSWRRDGSIPIDSFEDRTRKMNRLDRGWREDDPKGWLAAVMSNAVRIARNYHLARWQGQEYRVVVAVEKQALEGPFTEVCRDLEVDLAVCRGYPSISFLAEVAEALDSDDDEVAGRRNVIVYFGDYDPSGMDIPNVVERDLTGFFGKEVELRRIALTEEQIAANALHPAPVKLTDSRADGFVAAHGGEVYELDALEPSALQTLIRDAVGEYFDEDVFDNRESLNSEGRTAIDALLEEAGVTEFIKRLGGAA